MWIDLFVSAPVTLFLLWLYWYSRPAAAPRWSRVVDAAVLVASPAAVVAIIVVGHATVEWAGMGLNVMLVAGAYISLIVLLGIGWLQRFAAGR